MDLTLWVLMLLLALQLKHTVADYVLQTPRMLSGRDIYLHIGRAQHVGVHLVGSLLALVLCGVASGTIIAILIFEALAHYHIDWGKGVLSQRMPKTPAEAAYWRLHGFDQLLHQITYVVMIWMALYSVPPIT